MNTTIESIHYSNGTFEGELYSQYFQENIGFDGSVTYDSANDEIVVGDIMFTEVMPDEEYGFLKMIITEELAANYTYEVYATWCEDAHDWQQMHLEDVKTGN